MGFVPHTEAEKQEMLAKIGVKSVEDLIKIIPESVRLKGDLQLPPAIAEQEAVAMINNYAKMNKTTDDYVCFMGGGAYDHFIPAIVGSVIEKPEFKTAYTPYQAEISQGTLQAMYEYQSMICALTGMEISNASMYDCGTALAEACYLACAKNRKTHFVIAGTVNSHLTEVMESECAGKKFDFEYVAASDGTADLKALEAAITDNTSAVIVQHPNYNGTLEDVRAIAELAHAKKALFAVIVDPISLGVLETPNNYKADIVIAEGQSLGIPLCYGGPYLGILATTKDLLRQIPGRMSGATEDSDGNRGFVLTMQTREQHIKREKATSNICSNEGLYMLAAAVYMATMGKQGIKEVAEQSFQKAHYLAAEIAKIPGFSMANDKPFFKEFLVKTPVCPCKIVKAAMDAGIIAGIKVGDDKLLIAVTEKRTKAEMDQFVEVLKKF